MDSLAEDLATMVRRPLTPNHVAALRQIGQIEHAAAGKTVLQAGALQPTFNYLLSGEIELFDPDTDTRIGEFALGPGQFMGDIGFLANSHALYSMRAAQDSELLSVPRAAMLDLMAAMPEMSDIIVSVFAARRRRQLEQGGSALTIVGRPEDRRVRDVLAFAGRNRIPIRQFDPGSEGAAACAGICTLDPAQPSVILGRNEVLAPTPPPLQTALVWRCR